MPVQKPASSIPVTQVDISLDRDLFLRNLIRELSGVLEDVIGLEDSAGFISIVAQNMGAAMNQDYRQALQVTNIDHSQVAEVLVDLKARIQGGFYIIEQSEEKIVLGNHTCPFGQQVRDRPSMCMMTSGVLGTVVSENLGYAKVSIEEAIARRHPGCRVVIYLKPTGEAEAATGEEYFGTQV